MGTRSCAQIRSHCQKYFRRLRNKTFQELKRANQLQGKVFIITKEYFNYSGCSNQASEDEFLRAPMHVPLYEPGSTKTEEQKDSFQVGLFSRCEDRDVEQKFELFEEPKERIELEEGLFSAGLGFCGEAGFPSNSVNEVAFGDDYEERALPFLARVPYEA